MIRRGFWFAAGAVAGIAGYRRAERAVRMLLPQAGTGQPRANGHSQPRRPSSQGRPARGQNLAAGTAAFVRDVRTGMADYLDARRGI